MTKIWKPLLSQESCKVGPYVWSPVGDSCRPVCQRQTRKWFNLLKCCLHHANYTNLRIYYLFLSLTASISLSFWLSLSHSEFSNKNCLLAPQSEQSNWLQKGTCMISSVGTLVGTRSKTTWLPKWSERNGNSKASIYNCGNWNFELCSWPGTYIMETVCPSLGGFSR